MVLVTFTVLCPVHRNRRLEPTEVFMLRAIAGLLLALFITEVRAEATVAQGVFCDKVDQVEMFVRNIVEKSMSLTESIDATNEVAGANACLMSIAVVAEVTPVKELVIEGQHVVILKLMVVGVRTPTGVQPVQPLEQFIATKKNDAVKPSKYGIDA